MATVRRRSFGDTFVSIPTKTAKAVETKATEKPISLEALGLLTNLGSYADEWILRKTELYKRFAFNKERSVKKAWNELIEAGFMIEFKYRKGSTWEFVYIFDVVPYTKEQREIIIAENREEYGEISKLQNADLSAKTSTGRPQNMKVNKDKRNINKLNLNKLNKPLNNDDEEKEPFEINIYAFQEFKKEFNDNFENVFDEDFYSRISNYMTEKKIDFITYPEAVEQLKYMAEQKEKGLLIADSAKFFVGGIELRRTSKQAALNKAKFKKAEKELKERKEKQELEREAKKESRVPFYNWLEQ